MKSRPRQLGDADIRRALLARLRAEHTPDTLVIEEMAVCRGDARVDIAVVNGSLSGYEIKSDRDTLLRLPRQRAAYRQCFDTMTIVAGGRYLAAARRSVPPWWGIIAALPTDDGPRFEPKRPARPNPRVTPKRVVQLLWRAEVIASLESEGVPVPRSAKMRELWQALAVAAPRERVLEIVRERLKARGDWRSGPTPFQGGGSSRSSATSLHCPQSQSWLISLGLGDRPR